MSVGIKVEELVRQAENMGLTLTPYVYLNAMNPVQNSVIREKRNLKSKKFRTNNRIDDIVAKLKEQGVSGTEIRDAVYRELRSNNPEWGYYAITKEKKAEIRQTLIESDKIDALIQEIDEEIIEEMEVEIDYDISNHEAVNEICRLDFRPYFGLDIPRGDKFECLFFNGNTAWYSKDLKTGYYRYFTMNQEGKSYGLNFFDMMEVVYGYNFGFALRAITRTLKILYREGEWTMLQDLKYLQNITVVEKANTIIKKDFPVLFKYIKTYLPVLQKLLTIGASNVMSENYAVNGESVFFSSCTFIADFQKDLYKDVDKTKVNRAINVFATLGLIKKEDEAVVPSFLVERARARCGQYAQFNNINFYSIPIFDHLLLKQAEEVVKLLMVNGVTNKKVTRATVEAVLGEEKAIAVYGKEKEKEEKEDKPQKVEKEEYKEDDDDYLPF